MVLDRDAIYVIEGEGIPASAAFSLPDDADEILLKVKAGSDQRTWIGGALVVVGTLAVGAGFGGLIASTGDGVRPAPGQPDTRHETAKIGAIMVGIGILPLFAGLILRNTARTSVVTSTGSAFTSQNGSRQTRSPIALTPQGLTF
jgi:hypothetical protein